MKNRNNLVANQNKDTIKDTTLDSIEYSFNKTNNNKTLNLSESQRIGTIYSIEEKYDKYKNLENPFTVPDIPKNPAKERRTKIIHRINQERLGYQSKSVDNTKHRNKFLKKRNSHLSNDLFGDD